jgi:protein TonB
MAAAAASLPPPSPFGARDLRANARKFFERALVISALVHLSVVAAVRIVENRTLAGSDVLVEKGEYTFLIPNPTDPPLPWRFKNPAPPTVDTDGTIVPVTKKPVIEFPEVGIPGLDPAAQPVEDVGKVGQSPGDPSPPPPRDEQRVFTHVDTPPMPIDAPKPAYPDWAREAGVEGKVLLRVIVGVDGLPMQVDIVSGPKGLAEEAQKAVRRWKFSPGLSDGTPVRVRVEVPVVFRL